MNLDGASQVTSPKRGNLSVSLSVSGHPDQAKALLHNGFHGPIDNRVGVTGKEYAFINQRLALVWK